MSSTTSRDARQCQVSSSRGFERPNPHIDWASGVAEVVTEARDWPRSDVERIAGVSSFGFAGTNAHVIVADGRDDRALLRVVRERVHERFGIDHVTIQLEPEGFDEPDVGF